MGRTKMPLEMKQQHGTYQASRDGHALAIPKEIPSPPDWLAENARVHWEAVVGLFGDIKLLTLLDQTALALLCDAMGQYIAFRDDAADNGWTATSEKGGIYQHPSVGMMNKAFERVTKLLMHFGMTPVSRAKLAMSNKEAEDDPMSALLKRISDKRMTQN